MTSKARNLADLLADGFVGTNEIADGAITDVKIDGMDASKLSGDVATARLGSGTADSTTFLRGDRTFVTLPPAVIDDGAVNLNKLNTGTSSVSFTLPGQTIISIVLGRGALFPQITGSSAGVTLRPSVGIGTDPDSGRFAVSSSGNPNATSIAVHWRFINV